MEPKEGNSGGDAIDGGAVTTGSGCLRIYVGGLGGNVTADDLKKTFSSPQLGNVKSVEVVRTKGRSFAYLDFCPCSDKGLAKLFSTYNGCTWKGGRLRLEKAKEHYKLRLQREWEEDAELASISEKCDGDAVGSISPPEKLVKGHNSDNEQLRIFFPKLRKVKLLPFKGTGKHKYSFQRVMVPPLPTHFCDCDEHSVPSDTGRGSYNQENDVGGMKEDELNMMESVMNKLFKREKVSETAYNEARFATDAQFLTNSNDDLQVDEKAYQASDDDNLVINMVGWSDNNTTGARGQKTIATLGELQASQSRPLQRKHGIQGKKHFQQDEVSELPHSKVGHSTETPTPSVSGDDFQVDVIEDVMSDDENLIINAVAGSNKRITLSDSWEQTTITGNEELQPSQSEPSNRKRGIQGEKVVQSKKKSKTAPDDESERSGKVCETERKGNGSSHDSPADLRTDSNIQPGKPGSGVQHPSHDTQPAKRFSWRNLVSGTDDGCFRISDVIQSSLPASGKHPIPENFDVSSQGHQSIKISKANVVNTSSAEGISHMPIAETSTGEKSTLGLQKWKHILGGSESSFSISQIVPKTSLEKQEVLEVEHSDSSALISGAKHDTELNPAEVSLDLSKPTKMLQDGRSGEGTRTPQLLDKQTSTRSTSRKDYGTEEISSFKRSNASLKEWKMAKAALGGSHKKKVIET